METIRQYLELVKINICTPKTNQDDVRWKVLLEMNGGYSNFIV